MEDQFLYDVKNTLRKGLCGNLLPNQCRDDLQPQLDQLTTLLRRTVEYGESNSVLVVGMKGSGKSMLVRKCLEELSTTQKQYLVVQLNGCLQTDDRIALDEITRQLHLENTVGDRVLGTFAETLAFLLQALRSGSSSESLPILFILEEFDLFAQHKNQTLLYNLFDITQAGLTPMAVVGVTCRVDVIESLEKRVKSRFSHRQIFVCNKWTFSDYVSGFVDLLKLPACTKRNSKFRKRTNEWNSSIEELAKNSSVVAILKKQFHINKEITGLQRLLTLPVAKLSLSHLHITAADIADSGSVIFADPKLDMLRGVTVLELCLVIAMNHLTNIHSGEPFNFQMVYNEFLKFSKKKSHILQNYSKAVVFKAYEHLVELEFILPKDNKSIIASKTPKDYRPMLLLVSEKQLKDVLDKYQDCPTDVKQWAESSVL